MRDDDFPPPVSSVDFSDFEAGASYADDFSAHDFAPPEPERPEPEGRIAPPFPLDGIDLLSPPGFVGDVAAWIDSQCRYPRRRLAVASAIVTVGNIGGMSHDDALDGVTANMLAFCVAASATGKEAVQQAMAELHRAAGVHFAMQGGIKSEQEITRNLIEHQAAYYVIDEIGIFLSKVRNAQKRGGASYLEGVFGLVMSAYSKAGSRLLLQGDTKRELRKQFGAMVAKAEDNGEDADHAKRMLAMVDDGLDRPFLSLIGYTTPSTFDAVMDGEAAEQGFVGRSIIITEKDINPEARDAFRKRDVPEGMAMRLAQMAHCGTYEPHARPSRVEYTGERQRVTTDADAAQMLVSVNKWLHRYADEMIEHTGQASVAMIRRSYEMVAKISFILAIPGKVRTAHHVRWAFAYVRAELDTKIALVFANDNSRAKPEESLAARLASFLDAEKGTSTAVLANRVKLTVDDVAPVLGKMQAAGMVKGATGKRKYRGQPVMMWWSVDGA
jgi:hypothetical protein